MTGASVLETPPGVSAAQASTSMNDPARAFMSNRRFLRIYGVVVMVAGIIVSAAGTWSDNQSMLWGGISTLGAGLVWLICSRFTRDEPMHAEPRRYTSEFFTVMGGYVVLLFFSQAPLKHIHAVPLKMMLVLLPVLHTGFVVRAMVRAVLASDELERRLQLEAISIASMSVGLLSVAAAFLRDAGMLPINNALLLVLPAMFAAYGIASWWVRRRFRNE